MEKTGGYIRTEDIGKMIVIHPNEPVITKEEAEKLLRYDITKKLTQLSKHAKITMPDKIQIENFPDFINQENISTSFKIKFFDADGNEVEYERIDENED